MTHFDLEGYIEPITSAVKSAEPGRRCVWFIAGIFFEADSESRFPHVNFSQPQHHSGQGLLAAVR